MSDVRDLIEELPAILYRRLHDDAWTLLDASSAAARLLLGADEDRVEGLALLDRIHPDDREPAARALDGAPSSYALEYRLILPDRSELHVLDRGRMVREAERTVAEGLIVDLGTRALSAESPRMREARLHALFGAMPIIYWTAAPDGTFLHASGAWRNAPPSPVGQSIEERYPDAPQVMALHRRALAGESFGAAVEVRGRWYQSWYSPVRDETGAIVGVSGAALDITAQRRSEDSLKQSEELKRRIIEAVPAGIVRVDAAGAVREANALAQDILGLKHEELSQRYVTDFATETIREDGSPFLVEDYPVSRCLGTQQPQPPVTIGVRRPAGDVRWSVFRAEPLHDPVTGAFDGALVTFVEITDRKRAEEEKVQLELQLAHSQKLEAVGRLAGGVAHDFNNLLTGILGHASLITRQAAPGSDEFIAASTIELAAERAAGLTRQLLGFARKGKYQNVPLDLNRVVHDSLALLERTFDSRVAIVQRPWPEPALISGDPGQIEQVVVNLALNARDAMPEGGSLEVAIDRAAGDRAAPRHHPEARPGAHWVLSVVDDGVGMTAEVRERIFEPFFTTKSDGHGSGMGLPMTYGIVRNHGGWIHVESAPGKGTKMSIHLPVHEGATVQSRPPRPPSPVASGARVLLVDDEELVRRAAEAQLRMCGYRVETAKDGLEAVEVYQQRWKELDLVVLDLTMPRMDGERCFEELKRIRPDVRVLLSTGYGENETVQRCMARGVLGFIQKPYRLDELVSAINRCLES